MHLQKNGEYKRKREIFKENTVKYQKNSG